MITSFQNKRQLGTGTVIVPFIRDIYLDAIATLYISAGLFAFSGWAHFLKIVSMYLILIRMKVKSFSSFLRFLLFSFSPLPYFSCLLLSFLPIYFILSLPFVPFLSRFSSFTSLLHSHPSPSQSLLFLFFISFPTV